MTESNATDRRWGQRSDAATRVATAAQLEIRNSGYASVFHNVRCESSSDALVLRGRVVSFYFKQLAQEIARKTDGAKVIINELVVEERT